MKTLRLLPKKGQYRMRAHINPLGSSSFPFPPHHSYIDWRAHYPARFGLAGQENLEVYCNTKEHPSSYDKPRQYQLMQNKVTIVDIGCGFGGLLFGLSPLFPNNLILGMEIRHKLVDFVGEKIRGLRSMEPGNFDNIAVVRTNTMRHLCQYFPKASLEKMFICFPDPHFKTRKYRRRIINTGYLSEYAYLLKPKGRLYCITDVKELHEWHLEHLQGHRMFCQITDQEQIRHDPCVDLMISKTQEGQRVSRDNGEKYWAIFERRDSGHE